MRTLNFAESRIVADLLRAPGVDRDHRVPPARRALGLARRWLVRHRDSIPQYAFFFAVAFLFLELWQTPGGRIGLELGAFLGIFAIPKLIWVSAQARRARREREARERQQQQELINFVRLIRRADEE
ncbi:uncharacterized protein E1O_06550 [Burkholderiales bacterium GJ-E10]|nr:uncharacterized protein E1O_06550 [Burkholderiales bacterium GJ-E10]